MIQEQHQVHGAPHFSTRRGSSHGESEHLSTVGPGVRSTLPEKGNGFLRMGQRVLIIKRIKELFTANVDWIRQSSLFQRGFGQLKGNIGDIQGKVDIGSCKASFSGGCEIEAEGWGCWVEGISDRSSPSFSASASARPSSILPLSTSLLGLKGIAFFFSALDRVEE